MASSKPNRLAQLEWWRTHKVLFILTILVFTVIGFLLYEKIALYENRRNFQQARLAIDSVYADIVRQVGQPDNYKRANSCSRSYQEFSGYGDITCDVLSAFIYGVDNREEANKLLKKTQSIISNNEQLLPTRSLSPNIKDTLVVDAYYQTSHDYYKVSRIPCITSYVYDTPRQTEMTIRDVSKKPLEVTISCSATARSQFYPLAY